MRVSCWKEKENSNKDEDFFDIEPSPSKFHSRCSSSSNEESPESKQTSSRESPLLNTEIRKRIKRKLSFKKVVLFM